MFAEREIFSFMFTKREMMFAKREILIYNSRKYIHHEERHKMGTNDTNWRLYHSKQLLY